MSLESELVLQALQNVRGDLQSMEGRLNQRIDRIQPQCQRHAERLEAIEQWQARQRGVTATVTGIASGLVLLIGYVLSNVGKWVGR